MGDLHLIPIREACRRTSLSRTQINTLRSTGQFPRAVSLGAGRNARIAFVAAEVEAWIAARIAERDSKVAA